jgi:hypothetical protein
VSALRLASARRSARCQNNVLQIVLQCKTVDKTITIRLDRDQDAALTQRARIAGISRSALVRELLAKALSDQPISERAGHLKGVLRLDKPKTEWAKHLKKQNWR